MDQTLTQRPSARQAFRFSDRSAISPRLRRRRAAGALAAALAMVVLAACGGGSSSSTKATQDVLVTVNYPGRLLLSVPGPWTAGSVPVDHLSQLTSSSSDPTDLTDLPTDGYLNGVSVDGSLIAYNAGRPTAGQLTVFGGGGTQNYQGARGSDSIVFSPDGKRIAYNTGTSVEVSDPVSHRFVALPLPEECKSYSTGPSDPTAVGICGGVGGPAWLDPATLYVTHFVGEMPGSVSCPDSGRCTEPPNTASVVAVAGKVVASTTTPPIYSPVMARGKRVVLDGAPEQRSCCSWVDVDQLRAGTASVKSLPAGALMHSLSPDGTKIVFADAPGKPWELLDIRSGAVQKLGTRTTAAYWPVSDVPVFWSPDGKFFAVQVDGVLVPHSKRYGSFRPDPGGFGVAIWVVPASSEKGGLVATLPPTTASKPDSASEATVLVGWAS